MLFLLLQTPMPMPWHVVLYLMYLMCNCVYIFLYAISSLHLFLSLSHLSCLLVPPLLVLLVLLSLTCSPSSPSSTRHANSQAALPTSSHHVPRALPQEGKTLPPFPPFPCIDLYGNRGKEDRVLPPQVWALANACGFALHHLQPYCPWASQCLPHCTAHHTSPYAPAPSPMLWPTPAHSARPNSARLAWVAPPQSTHHHTCDHPPICLQAAGSRRSRD